MHRPGPGLGALPGQDGRAGGRGDGARPDDVDVRLLLPGVQGTVVESRCGCGERGGAVTATVRLAGRGRPGAVYALRHEVFVLGQDVPEDLERDELDDTCDHAVAVRGRGGGRDRPARSTTGGGTGTIGRMAVAEAARGRGLGAAVLTPAGGARPRARPAAVELHAQLHARGFYDRAGYAPYGETYLEAGIEHVSMRKRPRPLSG